MTWIKQHIIECLHEWENDVNHFSTTNTFCKSPSFEGKKRTFWIVCTFDYFRNLGFLLHKRDVFLMQTDLKLCSCVKFTWFDYLCLDAHSPSFPCWQEWTNEEGQSIFCFKSSAIDQNYSKLCSADSVYLSSAKY